MKFQAIGRITAHVSTDDVVLVNEDLHAAQLAYAAARRTVRAPVARALFEPTDAITHLAGLAAYVLWLEELHGDNDTDWLRA